MTNRHPDDVAAKLRTCLSSPVYAETLSASSIGLLPIDLVRVSITADGATRSELHSPESARDLLERMGGDGFDPLRAIFDGETGGASYPLDVVIVVDDGTAYSRLQAWQPRSAPMRVPTWRPLAELHDDRGQLDEATVSAIGSAMLAGDVIDPILVTHDGTIIDGRHRVAAARRAGWTDIDAVTITMASAENVRRYGRPSEVRGCRRVDRIATAPVLTEAA